MPRPKQERVLKNYIHFRVDEEMEQSIRTSLADIKALMQEAVKLGIRVPNEGNGGKGLNGNITREALEYYRDGLRETIRKETSRREDLRNGGIRMPPIQKDASRR